ncbi:MAG: Modification methylase HaeIII [Chroococcidiopsis sp. SAG 2025]|uniref:DNA cytosine methyltransferase n=1 Tax=Chroococcidiopsis sp. SAG 2025 TaxID=171389 RepID=UPI002936F111|nr:DNA cytosine methyltransferase [Chroococcidiopsis sp. SAG 2025]MDV2990810.1 Modification methylase HaeIII [Chroococcidiopsis sp. SAG 2025]
MRTVDLFAGCGGMSLGFQNAGFNLVAAFEYWLPAIEVYKQNFQHPIFERDLLQEDVYECINSFQPEMIIGGPPCQDFSSAGRRDENGGRADLSLAFANIIARIKPNWFVMENVDRIAKSRVLETSLEVFKESGYGLTSTILNAGYCGVPQTRKRYFLIGQLDGDDGNLSHYLVNNQSKNPMTVFEYLGDSLGIEYFYRHPRSYKRRAVFSIHEPSPTVRGVNRPIPKTYKKHAGDVCDIDENLRPLTTIERSYIQTFPKDFQFKGSKSDLEQMIGNAVPVKLAEYVARCILEYVEDSSSNIAYYLPEPLIKSI